MTSITTCSALFSMHCGLSLLAEPARILSKDGDLYGPIRELLITLHVFMLATILSGAVFEHKLSFFEYNQEVLTGLQTRKAWSVFAEAFMVEARETSTQCRRFSLPSFLEFMQLPSFLDDTH